MTEKYIAGREALRKAACIGTCFTFTLFSLGSSVPIAPSAEISLPKVLTEQQPDPNPTDKKLRKV
jgi:hypothetical protein